MLISKSRVYELALSSINAQHVGDFRHEYLPRIAPILTEYGGRFLINGIVLATSSGKFPVESFAILEWPSIDHFVKINADKRVIPLIDMRNRFLDFIIEGCFYRVLEDTSFEFPQNRVMNLLLTDRAVRDDWSIRFRWIDDPRNSKLSSNVYFFSQIIDQYQYDKDRDVEELSVQVL